MSVRRSLSAVALAALAVGALASPGQATGPLVRSHGVLTDLQATSAPTDGARASVSAWRTSRGTTVVLRLRGLDRDHAGHRFGAHVHVGECVAGAPAVAGPHYNITGQPPTTISDRTEVWLDFTVGRGGTAHAIAHVPFAIPSGDARSVVVHEHGTDPVTGAAGARLACLPVDF